MKTVLAKKFPSFPTLRKMQHSFFESTLCQLSVCCYNFFSKFFQGEAFQNQETMIELWLHHFFEKNLFIRNNSKLNFTVINVSFHTNHQGIVEFYNQNVEIHKCKYLHASIHKVHRPIQVGTRHNIFFYYCIYYCSFFRERLS